MQSTKLTPREARQLALVAYCFLAGLALGVVTTYLACTTVATRDFYRQSTPNKEN